MPKNKRFGSTPKQNLGSGAAQIIGARVKFVMLNDKEDPDVFKNNGEWSGLGGVVFESIRKDSPIEKLAGQSFAKPLFPNIKIPPVKNEFIYIIRLPNPGAQTNVGSTSYYYFQPINCWNSVHHNAVPSGFTALNNANDYDETSTGFVRKVEDGSTDIDLGKTFTERIDTRNLQLYEGDVVLQGRWGNSIRFGSTVRNSTPLNLWSDTGQNGDPITIIRNGQYKDTSVPTWQPQLESVNRDPSSIYLTSTQRVPIGVARSKYDSYTGAFGQVPSSPGGYGGSQVILNAGRLVFNAKSDHVLLAARRTISFNCDRGFNFDTDANFVVKVGGTGSNTINLGDRADNGADEPLILGNKFLTAFQEFLMKFNSLCGALPSTGTPQPFTPNVAVAFSATDLQVTVQKMLNEIEKYKSEVTFTK